MKIKAKVSDERFAPNAVAPDPVPLRFHDRRIGTARPFVKDGELWVEATLDDPADREDAVRLLGMAFRDE